MDLVYIIVCGIIGTSAMTFVMWLITKEGLANADMVRAIGSIFSGKENALSTGMIIHYVAGIVVAFIYLVLISLFLPTSLLGYAVTGTAIGIFHGVAFAFILVVVVAEHHPQEEFRNAGLEVALAHLAGHIVYGLVVGIVAGLLSIRIIF